MSGPLGSIELPVNTQHQQFAVPNIYPSTINHSKMLIGWHQTEHSGLPAPLPLQDQIESSEEVLSDMVGRRVVGVGRHYVVKLSLIHI